MYLSLVNITVAYTFQLTYVRPSNKPNYACTLPYSWLELHFL